MEEISISIKLSKNHAETIKSILNEYKDDLDMFIFFAILHEDLLCKSNINPYEFIKLLKNTNKY